MWARRLYAGSCFLGLLVTAACLWVAACGAAPAAYVAVLLGAAVWVLLQTALSYMGDVHEFLELGTEGPWGLADRSAALATSVGSVAIIVHSWTDGVLAAANGACVVALFAAAFGAWTAGVVILRRTGTWSAAARPNLWALCHTTWHVLCTAAVLTLVFGLRGGDTERCPALL